MILGTVIYAVILSSITVGRYYALHTFAWDLGAYSQAVYTTAFDGRFFFFTPDLPNNPGGSMFGVHFAPILFLLVPIYRLVPVPGTLLVVQSLALASGAPLVFKLARTRLSSEAVAGSLAFVYLLNPAVQGVNWFDFHPEAFLIPFALLTICFWERHSWRWFWVSLLASLSTLEMAGLVMFALGLYWLLSTLNVKELRTWIRRKETWAAAIVCVAGTASTLLGVATVFLFNPGLANEMNTTWQLVGATSIYQLPVKMFENPGGVVAGLLWDWPVKALYLVLLFGPVLFLPFRRPLSLVMLAPWLLAALTSSRPTFYAIGDQYPSFLIPFLFYAAILGAERSFTRGPDMSSGPALPPRFLHRIGSRESRSVVVLMAVAAAFFVIASPVGPIGADNYRTGGLPTFDSHVSAVWSAVNLVPRDATILTQNNLFPYFADRVGSYVVPVGSYFRPGATFNGTLDGYLNQVDYVLVDMQTSVVEAASILTRPLVQSDFGALAWSDGVILLRRGYVAAPIVGARVSAVFNYESLLLEAGTRVEDPTSISRTALFHPSGGGVDFWGGPLILLWPGEYNLTFRLRIDTPVTGHVLSVGADVQSVFLDVKEMGLGGGYYVVVDSVPAPCVLPLASKNLGGSDFGNATGYREFTVSFRADVFGLYRFPGDSPANATGIYLDQVALTQETALGYYRTPSCP